MRKHGRVDSNQDDIVKALRKVGASVWITSSMGDGGPDLVVGYHDAENYLLEVKAGDGALTDDELTFRDTWRGQYAVVRTPEQALQAIGAI